MSRRLAAERGGGLLGTALGLGVLVTLMLLAAQVLTHLYATTVVEAVVYDAAAQAAGAAGDLETAEAAARESLGPFGAEASFDWSASTPEEVVLQVVVPRAQTLSTRTTGDLGLGTIRREARVRIEQMR